MNRPTVVAYGGGLNSTALLIGLHEQDRRPDLILFADTKGEKPETYAFLDIMGSWLESVGFPAIDVVTNAGRVHDSLEEECLTNKTLPSKTFGNPGCSVKWKIQPQDRYIRGWSPAIDAWGRGERVIKLIGIDADESHRAKAPQDSRFEYKYPLIEWDWGRDECADAVRRVGLLVPTKSACWFCPSSRKGEVLDLARRHPDLANRAVEMERNANLTSMKGLGRRWSWGALLAADEAQLKLFPDAAANTSCICFDGDSPVP